MGILSKIVIPAKIASVLKDVVVDVISRQIEHSISKKSSAPAQEKCQATLSSLQCERELRTRIDKLEEHMSNAEALVHQGLRLYESTVQQLTSMNHQPQIVINGNATFHITINYSERGVQVLGQASMITRDTLSELVECECRKLFDMVDTGNSCASPTHLSRREKLLAQYDAKVKELRK